MALVNYDTSDEESVVSDDRNDSTIGFPHLGSDSVEPEYHMRVPTSAKLPSLIPDLITQKSKTGKILLSVPTLETLDSSSDEDNTCTAQRNAPSYKSRAKNALTRQSARGGLLALLPPTRCAPSRDGHKPTLLVPTQVQRKLPTAIQKIDKKTELKEPAIAASPTTSEESDNELETTAFFTFYQPSETPQQSVASVRAAMAENVKKSSNASPEDSTALPIEVATDERMESVRVQSLKAPSTAVSDPLAPLCSIDPYVLKQFSTQKLPSTAADDEEDGVSNSVWTEETFVPGPERKRARLAQPNIRAMPVADLLRSSSQPIREINQADLTAGAAIELMKSVTSDESQYVSQRTIAEDDPGKLAHRKHQITWLAHQAQANEMELEKRWAEARRNKASNRAKYGF